MRFDFEGFKTSLRKIARDIPLGCLASFIHLLTRWTWWLSPGCTAPLRAGIFLEVHYLQHHCTCTDASQEDLGGPCQAAKPGEVWIRQEVCAVNKLSTSAEHIFSDSNQNFYFKTSQSTRAGPICKREDGAHGEGQPDKQWSTKAETQSLRASPLPIHK